MLRQGINFLVQGFAADLFKIAMIRVHNILQGSLSRLVMPIHDELVMYVNRRDFPLISEIKEQMEDFDLTVPMVVDISWTQANWAEKRTLKLG